MRSVQELRDLLNPNTKIGYRKEKFEVDGTPEYSGSSKGWLRHFANGASKYKKLRSLHGDSLKM